MVKQAIHINGLENHLLCPMQCCLNGVHINVVPKFLAENPSLTTDAIQLTDPFAASVTSYFDVYSPSIA